MGKLYVESYGWNNVKISECQNIGHDKICTTTQSCCL